MVQPRDTSATSAPAMPELAGVEHTYVDVAGLRVHVALAGPTAALQHGFAVFGHDLGVVHLARLDGGSARRETGIVHHRVGAAVLDGITTQDGLLTVSPEDAVWQVALLSGLEGGVVVEKVRNLPVGQGLNAATGVYVDMIAEGIIDPAKVTRSALQNAASIAALFLTTEAVIADKPEKASAGAGGGMPGGGMGDMDF